MTRPRRANTHKIEDFLNTVFDGDVHAKRILSMANATLGVLINASLGIFAIGQGLADAKGLTTKHAVKQVDRLLSNQKVNVNNYFAYWVPYIIGHRQEIVVAMDWTEFDADGHATIAINMTTKHGRATPLLWKTVNKSELKNNRNQYEDDLLLRFKEVIPEGIKVTILADRGFGDQKLFEFLKNDLGFEFVIRIRGNITVTDAKRQEARAAQDWVGKGGRARLLRNACVTLDGYEVGSVICVQRKDMKEVWCLVCSSTQIKANEGINLYSKRWSIEPNFRDSKDPHFGMGLSQTRIKSEGRRDRLLLIGALAMAFLTLLGAAGENLGFDKYLKVNTVKRRVHSLFRQGVLWYQLIPNMAEERLRSLMEEFGKLLKKQKIFDDVLGFI